jgi:hypothetical protein
MTFCGFDADCWQIWASIAAVLTFPTTLIGLIAIVFTLRATVNQLRFGAWLKIQQIWTNEEFTNARGRLFARLDNPKRIWTKEEKDEALWICQKMDEFAGLVIRFLDMKDILEIWYDPVGKTWFLLRPVVQEERQGIGWSTKWERFEDLGERAYKMLLQKGWRPPDQPLASPE